MSLKAFSNLNNSMSPRLKSRVHHGLHVHANSIPCHECRRSQRGNVTALLPSPCSSEELGEPKPHHPRGPGEGFTREGCFRLCQHHSSLVPASVWPWEHPVRLVPAPVQLCQHQSGPVSINPALPAPVQPCQHQSSSASIIPALPASVQHSQQHQSPTSTGPALHQHHSSPVSVHPALWLLPWPPRHATTPNPCGGGRCPAGAPSPRGCSFKQST